jgi:hypothetical protein
MLAAVFSLHSAAFAQTSTAQGQQIFSNFQEAVTAFERCYRPLDPMAYVTLYQNRTFRLTSTQQAQVQDQIAQFVSEQIGAGRSLELLERAKSKMSMRIAVSGCDSSTVRSALAIYQTQLAAAIST